MTCDINPRSRKWLLIGEYYASDGVYLDDIIYKGTYNQCADEAGWLAGGEYTSFHILHESELEDEEDE